MILAIFAVICATAWLVTVAVPALLAAPLEAAVTALHRQIERSGSLARRIVPERWTGSISDAPLIGLLAAVLIFGLWAFFGILEDVVMGDPIVGLDTSVYARLQEVRTAPFDRLLVAITGLGDRSVVVPVALAGLVTLGLLGRWREAWYLMAAVAGAADEIDPVAGPRRTGCRPARDHAEAGATLRTMH